jgi:hypothetical protein
MTGVQTKIGSGVAGTSLASGGRRAAEKMSGPAGEELGWRRTRWGCRGGGGQDGDAGVEEDRLRRGGGSGSLRHRQLGEDDGQEARTVAGHVGQWLGEDGDRVPRWLGDDDSL